MATLAELRQEWAETHDQMYAATLPYDQGIEELTAKADEVAKPFAERLKQLETIMRPMVNPDTPNVGQGVKIAHRREYERVHWDSKGLDGFAVAEPRLLNFRTVKTTKASTSFSRTEDE